MRVLTVNAGSSNLKLSVVEPADHVSPGYEIPPWEGQDGEARLEAFATRIGHVDAIGHRVVHGGDRFTAATLVDDIVIDALHELSPLASIHQPRCIAGIRALQRILPEVPAVACFDTSFHATLPPAAYTYALPSDWTRRWSIRRYGFHGLSHAYAARRAAALLDRPVNELRLITCHLGAGASLCAVNGGRSVDTTMGFTPLEGLVMATRSGSIDPGIALWLINHAGMSATEVADGLDRRAGLAGLTDGTGDMRDVVAARSQADAAATLALDVYLHRLRHEIAGMTASLNGVDAVVFTGGVGEHQPAIRAEAAAGLRHLGITINAEANIAARGDTDISTYGAAVRTLVITAREDLEIARQTRELLMS